MSAAGAAATIAAKIVTRMNETRIFEVKTDG